MAQSKTDAALHWLNQAGCQPLLTAAEELHLGALVRAWQDQPDGPADAPAPIRRRGIKARDRFVCANLRLCAHVVGKRGGVAIRTGEIHENGLSNHQVLYQAIQEAVLLPIGLFLGPFCVPIQRF